MYNWWFVEFIKWYVYIWTCGQGLGLLWDVNALYLISAIFYRSLFYRRVWINFLAALRNRISFYLIFQNQIIRVQLFHRNWCYLNIRIDMQFWAIGLKLLLFTFHETFRRWWWLFRWTSCLDNILLWLVGFWLTIHFSKALFVLLIGFFNFLLLLFKLIINLFNLFFSMVQLSKVHTNNRINVLLIGFIRKV